MALEGKVALVTGSSEGIGRAIALRLARDGADICVNYRRDAADADAVRQQVETIGRRVIVVQADVAKLDDVRRLVGETASQLGRLDILVNNAGIEIERPFLDVTEEDYDRVLSVNLKGAYFCAQTAARQMIRQGQGGRIVNISSVHEDLPMPGNSPYCASKGGMRMMMRTICLELAPHRITVNDVAPGAIATPINRQTLHNPQLLSELLAEIPLSRVGTPEDVAGAVAFLVSLEGSYVTGSTYFIDGGLMRHTGGL
ncbi:MAG TPA: SDR family oxidoreductase [Chloroflexota bacterium]|nr:SDR family oxidoreductase [Chloroflexota bacterium]